MSQLDVNAIRSTNGTGDAISLTAADKTCTANIINFPHRNLLFNGAMNVSQRNDATSANVESANTSNHSYVLDRWQVSNANGGGTFAVQQVEDGPAGFNYSQKITTSVADDGGADSFCVVQQRIEGYNGNHLEFGTANAKTVTISFWVKSSLTGTFGASLVAGNYDKMYVFQYTISSPNNWEKKTVTIAGPTSGGTYYKTNSRYCVLYFDLGSGSDGEASAANDWAATGTWMYGHRIAGNQKVSTNANATWQITGVQMEVSDYGATDFEHRSYGDELAKCQRYFYKVKGSGNYMHLYTIRQYDNIKRMTVQHPVEMRAAPSCTFDTVSEDNGGTISANWTSQYWMQWAQSGGTSAQAGSVSEFSVSAEL
tara:strand:+ start:18883 stop:19989 length:1107 start_codon:yes stop_codon:yes gene_type:complete